MLDLAEDLFTITLYLLYSMLFSYFFLLEAELKPEPDRQSLWYRLCDKNRQFLDKHRTLARIHTRIYLYWYLPVFRPVFWWRCINAEQDLLEAIGWIDIDLDQ